MVEPKSFAHHVWECSHSAIFAFIFFKPAFGIQSKYIKLNNCDRFFLLRLKSIMFVVRLWQISVIVHLIFDRYSKPSAYSTKTAT